MTIDETIKHCENVAEEQRRYAHKCEGIIVVNQTIKKYKEELTNKYIEGANEYQQLAEWLKELKRLREQTKWTPISEGLPKKEGLYIVTVKNEHDRRYSKSCWFHGDGNWFARQDVLAWMPSPASYESKESEEKE